MSDPIPSGPPGPRYFITLRLAHAGDDLLVRHVDALRRAMRQTRAHHPFEIDAIAVLPAALHTLWTLPGTATPLHWRISMLKSKFSRAMPAPTHRSAAQIARGDKGIWQRNYWAIQVTDASEYDRMRTLIHSAPVEVGLCATPADWPHSSIHRDQRATPRVPRSAQITPQPMLI